MLKTPSELTTCSTTLHTANVGLHLNIDHKLINSYSLAGSVLRMFQNAFGDSTWKKGLNYYLNARANDYGTPDHLHEGIQRAVTEDFTSAPTVADIMNSWENQGGFPFVTVTRTETELKFEQNRFLYTGRDSVTALWSVPINYVVGSNPDFTNTLPDLWMSTQTQTILSSSSSKPFTANDWIIANIQQTGYYRVNYDAGLWNANINQLTSATGFQSIHLFNRAQLIDDSFHFARAGLLNFSTPLRVMDYLHYETDYIPWAPMNRANTLLNRWLGGTNVYPAYLNFMSKNVDSLYNRLTANIIDSEPRVDRYARIVAINIACQSQHTSCLDDTSERVARVVYNGDIIQPDLVSSVYCNGLRTANATVYTAIRYKMLMSTTTTERTTLQSALGCSQSSALLISHLETALVPGIALTSTEKNRILLSPLNYGENSIRTMINFARTNGQEISSLGLINTMCANIANRIHTQELYNEFSTLLDSLRALNLLTATQGSTYLNTATTLLNWQTENLASIADWFNVDEITTAAPTEAPIVTTPTTQEPVTPTTQGAGNIAVSAIILTSSVLIKFLI